MSRAPRTAAGRSLSQHRLRNRLIADRIVAASGLAPPARVIEAGAGDGMLTLAVAARAGVVVAIEKDREQFARLRIAARQAPNVRPVLQDFLAFPLPANGAYHVIANLPFSLTSATMRRLLSAPNPPRSTHLVLERDAALHWTGGSGESVRGLVAKLRFTFVIPLALRRHDFDPYPSVETVLLAVRRRPRPLLTVSQERAFEALVARGFGRGRRTARANLATAFDARRLGAAAGRARIDLDRAPAAIPFEAWLHLWQGFEITR